MTVQPYTSVHDQLADRYLQLTEQIEALQEQREAVKGAIRAMIGIGAINCHGGVKMSVTPNRRLNLDQARAYLTEQQITDCSITVLSNPLVKKALSPELVEACMAEIGDPIVRVV